MKNYEIGYQFVESVTVDYENEIEEMHLMEVIEIDGDYKFRAKDLGRVDENGCLPTPWDKNLYP